MRRNFTRRGFSKLALAAAAQAGAALRTPSPEGTHYAGIIDRKAVIARHNVVLTACDIMSPLSVGNGEFAFTADVTGLQTFSREYRDGIPLSTMSQWGFHTAPNPNDYSLARFPLTYLDTGGRQVGYLYYDKKVSPPELGAAARYLYSNPSRMNLGQVAAVLRRRDGTPATLSDIEDIRQELHLWEARLVSEFHFDGQPARVTTICHPEAAQLAVSIESPLLATGQLSIALAFPYASPGYAGDGADWNHPESHQTVLRRMSQRRAEFDRRLDQDEYFAAMDWSPGAAFARNSAHAFSLTAASGASTLRFTVAFSRSAPPAGLDGVASISSKAEAMWSRFWMTGGAIDLSASRDPRWRELERRIVLSQYLTRIQCAGSLPPQETGLTCNSWYGKFHLEMHWWHAAHFALWGRHDLLERSLAFYQRILPKARAQAHSQGYEGARWPKCVGPSGDPAPTYLECFLIWQQPHPIFYAELCYRARRFARIPEAWSKLVFETAKFMATFCVWDGTRREYRIGPPIADAAEIYSDDHEHQWNPTFEVAYWRFGLETAQRWRERLGLGRDLSWDHILTHLPPLAVRDDLYVAADTARDTFHTPGRNTSHPCMLAPLGMLDGSMVDPAVMRNTLRRVMDGWEWNGTWGWDYPLIAMTAARLGEPDTAIEALLMPEEKNTYLVNGHNFQKRHLLPVYLPGNGGLLYAVAMMAGGWEGAPHGNAPGFPSDGSWSVRTEGFHAAP